MAAEPKATTDFDALVNAAYQNIGKLTLTPANYWAQIVFPHSSGIIFEVPLNQTPDMDMEVLQDKEWPRISCVLVCWRCADSVERFFVLVGGGYAADILNFNNAWRSVTPAATVAHIMGVTTRFVMDRTLTPPLASMQFTGLGRRKRVLTPGPRNLRIHTVHFSGDKFSESTIQLKNVLSDTDSLERLQYRIAEWIKGHFRVD